MKAKFIVSCLEQKNVTYHHGKIVNIYIAFEIFHITVGAMIILL